MKKGFDISMITKDKAGIGYYASELLKSLLRKDPDNYFLFTNSENNIPIEFKDRNVIVIKSKAPGFLWIVKVSWFLVRNKFDLFISPSNFLFGILFPKTIQIVHDLSPVKYPEFFGKSSSLKYKYMLKLAIKRSLFIATNSNTTRQDIIDSYKTKHTSKIRTIGIGLNSWALEEKNEKQMKIVKHKYDLPDNFILSLSTLEPRKNHKNMIRAFADVSKQDDDLFYVIAGKKGWLFDDIFELVKNLKLEHKIKFIGYVDEKDLASLIDLSKLLLYVSIWEGVGMPPMEALIRNKPVVVSDLKVFKEFLESKAVFVDPSSPESIKKGIDIGLKSDVKNVYDLLDEYSWEKVSDNLINLTKP